MFDKIKAVLPFDDYLHCLEYRNLDKRGLYNYVRQKRKEESDTEIVKEEPHKQVKDEDCLLISNDGEYQQNIDEATNQTSGMEVNEPCDDVVSHTIVKSDAFEIDPHEEKLQIYHESTNDIEMMEVITEIREESFIKVDQETFTLLGSKIDQIVDGVWMRDVYLVSRMHSSILQQSMLEEYEDIKICMIDEVPHEMLQKGNDASDGYIKVAQQNGGVVTLRLIWDPGIQVQIA